MFFYIVYDIVYDIVSDIDISFCSWQIHRINKPILLAKQESPLYRLPMLEDPSKKACCRLCTDYQYWKILGHIQARKFDITVESLQKLHGMSFSLLELLKANLPVKSGKFLTHGNSRKHTVFCTRCTNLLLFGWSQNVSTQGLEHCHIDVCKKVAACTNNKDVFLTILRHLVREDNLQCLQKLQADLADEDSEQVFPNKAQKNGWPETIRFPANSAFDILFCRLFFLVENNIRA
jgi:hypothetical protein